MSTILEALKKSEQERKLNKLPTLNDMPPPQERARWPIGLLVTVCVLLVALLLLLAVRWWQPYWGQSNQQKSEVRIVSNETIGLSNEGDAQSTQGNEIVVNVISYSDTPDQRFAMINGKMVRENEFVRAGLRVDKIEPDGVVLNMRGERIRREP